MENYLQDVNDELYFHYNLGNTLKELNRLYEAKENFIKALSIDPNFSEAYFKLGQTLIQLDRLFEAEKSLQNLHGVLYHQINKYGSVYLDQMKQFDAGLYSVSDIDEKIDSLNDQTAYLVDLLQKDIQPNDLVKDNERT